MTQEEKELLLRDLCARLPYKPIVHANDGLSLYGKGSDYTLLGINANKHIVLLGLLFDDVYATHKEYLDNVKPYLRPMSDITEEELDELKALFSKTDIAWKDNAKITCDKVNGIAIGGLERGNCVPMLVCCMFTDFCYQKHIDCNNLIEKGLAIEAPKKMYNNKK